MAIKVTAAAHPNLALVKYWGQLDRNLNIPQNNSISVNLSGARTVTSVSFDAALPQDRILLDGQRVDQVTYQRISDHLDRIRALAGLDLSAQMTSYNNFPVSVGFASSASAYAALSLAASRAAGLDLSERELSILARKGSGSACRSIPDGFVEWYAGYDDDSSYAASIAPVDYWDIAIVSVLLSDEPKSVSSIEGHAAISTSPFAAARLTQVATSLRLIKDGLKVRDFATMGMQVEREAVAFHTIAMTSRPEAYPWLSGIFYWNAGTVQLIQAVQRWRREGLEVYFTLDAGPTVHLLCEAQLLKDVQLSLHREFSEPCPGTIVSHPGQGAWVIGDKA